jgi:hypothetical protein
MTWLQHKELGIREKDCECCYRFPLCLEWSCLGEMSCESKNRRRWLYKVRIGIAEPMRVCDMKGVTWWAKRTLGSHCDPKSLMWLQGIPIWKTPTKQVIATRLWRIHLRWYFISTFLLQVKMHLWVDVYDMMHAHDVHGMVQCNM